MEWQIGEFSVMTRLSVKTLRYYHEEGILIPSRIDDFTGYRYYDTVQAENARVITTFRDFDFTIEEIKRIIADCGEDGDLLSVLEEKSRAMRESMKEMRAKARRLDELLGQIREEQTMTASEEIRVMEFGSELIATVRYKGKYSDFGTHFGKLFKTAGSAACGKAFGLYHDDEYKEDGADIEVGVPVRKAVKGDGVDSRTLPACKAVVIVHRGPYDALHASYAKVMEYVKASGIKTTVPIREIYLKGPGMIFRGNPKNYLTEIRIPIAE